jgi:putative ABC transport system permease protein
MKAKDLLSFSLNNITHRGLRSWLTILGIVIGVAAVVAIISLGIGTQRAINTQLSTLGTDVITVTAGFNRASFQRFDNGGTSATSIPKNLTDRDLKLIKSIPEVLYINGIISDRVQTSYLSQTASLTVQGVDPLAWNGISSYDLDSGRLLIQSDVNSIVIGNSVANTVFKQTLSLGAQLTIGGKPFKVAGVLEKSGGFGGNDNIIFMPITAARNILTDIPPTQFSSIQLKVTDPSVVESVSSDIENKLLLAKHETNATKSFTILSVLSIQSTISTITGTLNLFLGGIAAISLLVGAIGIANTMFTSVIERTRQIGTLKALGATNSDIMKLFVLESSLIGLAGGILGVSFGFIVSGAISEIGMRSGFGPGSGSLTVITPELIVAAIAFSVIIGAISGFVPARMAANLQPVEALRYE